MEEGVSEVFSDTKYMKSFHTNTPMPTKYSTIQF